MSDLDDYDLVAFDRLFDKTITKDNGCIEFMGSRTVFGYGMLGYRGKVVRAHRLAYFLCTDEIPEDKAVLHSCDNSPCVNPAHLFLGTVADNNSDKKAKGRHRSNPPKGSARSDSKLTEGDVIQIRDLYTQGYSQREIASTFEVNQSVISVIINRKAWKHV